MTYVGLKHAFCPNTTLSVYREGFIAEFMGRTRTAVQAYTSAGTLLTSVSARSPEIYGYESTVFRIAGDWIKTLLYNL